MNVLNLKYQQVTHRQYIVAKIIAYLGTIADVALNVFAGLSSADGYKTMLSHLGPDPKVRRILLLKH